MQNSIPLLRPQAIADYLWHRFELQPGRALCMALSQPLTRSNYDALVAWARDAVDRYRALGVADPIFQIEGDLFERMHDAGLVGFEAEVHSVPDSVICRLFEPDSIWQAIPAINPESGKAAQSPSDPTDGEPT